MSIRLRLTLLYSAILAFTLIAFSAILYVSQTRATYDSIKANLVRQAAFITGPPDGARPDGPPPGEFPAMRVFVEGDQRQVGCPAGGRKRAAWLARSSRDSRDLGDVLCRSARAGWRWCRTARLV